MLRSVRDPRQNLIHYFRSALTLDRSLVYDREHCVDVASAVEVYLKTCQSFVQHLRSALTFNWGRCREQDGRAQSVESSGELHGEVVG